MKCVAMCLLFNVVAGVSAGAQSLPVSPDTAPTESSDTLMAVDDDGVLRPAEPDFVVVNLPTGMRLPLFKGNFRLTHRFAGNLRRGNFSDQASSLFGIDQGAVIGFEYRLAVAKHLQAAFYRSSFDRTIQLYGKYDAVRQGRALPVSMSALVSIEGTDNFQEKFAPAVGVVASRLVGTRVAAYLTPLWVDNSAASLEPVAHDDSHDQATASASSTSGDRPSSTTYLGVGGRVRIGGSTYVAAEIAPRLAGYAPDQPAYGVSVEKRAGSHMFSLTFTNTFGTTFGQVARGGASSTLFLGFNLGRKFL